MKVKHVAAIDLGRVEEAARRTGDWWLQRSLAWNLRFVRDPELYRNVCRLRH